MPELVVLPPELVAGKKENRPREVSRFRIYGLRMTQAVQTPASTL